MDDHHQDGVQRLRQEYEARVEFANGKMLIDAAQEITIQCGNSKIVLSPQAVTISAPSVNLAGNEGTCSSSRRRRRC